MDSYTHQEVVKEEFDKIMSKLDLPKDCRILEIGPGLVGAYYWLESKGFDMNNYIGIDDQSEYTSELINKKIKGQIFKMDAHRTNFVDEYFDFIFMSHVSEHFTNPIVAWNEIFRILKKTGVVVSITPNCCEHQILNGDVSHWFVLNEMQIRRILGNLGFDVVTRLQTEFKNEQIPKIQDYNIITIARKK